MNQRYDNPVAVTGGTGMVGSHIVATLLERGYTNIVLPVRENSDIHNLEYTLRLYGHPKIHTGVRPVPTDFEDLASVGSALARCSLVFHCAASVSLDGKTDREQVTTNVELTKSVVAACIDNDVDKLIHISSIAAIGKPANGKMSNEDDLLFPDQVTSSYGRSKLLSEKVVTDSASRGLDHVILNPAVILGASSRRSGSSRIISAVSSGVPFYTGGVCSYVDVRDVARAAVELAVNEDAINERFILCGGHLSYRELLTIGARAAGKRTPFIPVGRIIALPAAYLCRAFSFMTGRKSPLTVQIARSLFGKRLYDGSHIEKKINFAYTPLPETIRGAISNYNAAQQ